MRNRTTCPVTGEGTRTNDHVGDHCARKAVYIDIFFGISLLNNDINVVEASSLSSKMANENYPTSFDYKLAGDVCVTPYWLGEGVSFKIPIPHALISAPDYEQGESQG